MLTLRFDVAKQFLHTKSPQFNRYELEHDKHFLHVLSNTFETLRLETQKRFNIYYRQHSCSYFESLREQADMCARE